MIGYNDIIKISLSLYQKNLVQIPTCFTIFWVDTECLSKMKNGLLQSSLLRQCNSQVVVRVSIVWSDTQCLIRMLHGLLQHSLLAQSK